MGEPLKHSPAPWRWVEEHGILEASDGTKVLYPDNVPGGDGRSVADMLCGSYNEGDPALSEANAILLAAAPLLLQSLREMMPDDYASRFKADCTGGVAKGMCAACRAWALLVSIDAAPVPPPADPEDVR